MALLLGIMVFERACPSVAGRNPAFNHRLQWRQVVRDNVPDDFGFGRMVSVSQQIPEVDHFPPIDYGLLLFDLLGDSSRGLAHNFEQTFDQEASPPRCKLGKACALHHIFDFDDCLKNIPQPIFDSWRHSEHLDHVVGDPLDDSWFQ
jgi:hypothetical protein